jgi:hypothetical protein
VTSWIKPYSLIELLIAPEGDAAAELLVAAIQERLEGRRGVACAELGQAVEATRAVFQDPARGWTRVGASDVSATRRDGVHVYAASHPRIDVDPATEGAFFVSFPPKPGGLIPTGKLEAKTLGLAVAEVDRRWPMPAWWTGIDTTGTAYGVVPRLVEPLRKVDASQEGKRRAARTPPRGHQP